VRGLADTGFLVAFANRNDRHHEWAVGVAEQVTEPLLTCEAVLAEAAFHLRNVRVVLAMVQEGRSSRPSPSAMRTGALTSRTSASSA
jgi:predicted nucleic acid-binding protein